MEEEDNFVELHCEVVIEFEEAENVEEETKEPLAKINSIESVNAV